MRFLYVAPRYHTNQVPVMEGLTENGHEVAFFSHYAGKTEDYSCVKPEIIGYSALFRIFDYIYVKLLHRNDSNAIDKKLLWGFPPLFFLNRKMKEFCPDVVIIRERSIYSIITYFLCRLNHYPAILYNQNPVYMEVKNDWAHRIIKMLTPEVRMTPVMGIPGKGKEKEFKAVFVPFIMNLRKAPEGKVFCKDGVIHILTVAKYTDQKKLFLIVEVIGNLAEKYPVHLTIAGECSTKFHKEYLDSLRDYVESRQLGQRITFLTNLGREEVDQEYEKADLFVLPSTREWASISQLEAMAFSVPIVCSNTNGTAYIKEGYNGYVFQDRDVKDLLKVVEKSIQSPEQLQEMGRNAYMMIKEKYQFKNYYEGIKECLEYLGD